MLLSSLFCSYSLSPCIVCCCITLFVIAMFDVYLGLSRWYQGNCLVSPQSCSKIQSNVHSLTPCTLGVRWACMSLEMGTKTRWKGHEHFTYMSFTQARQSRWLMQVESLMDHEFNLDLLHFHGVDLGGGHYLALYGILCAFPWRLYLNVPKLGLLLSRIVRPSISFASSVFGHATILYCSYL